DQRQAHWQEDVTCLERRRQLEPQDVVVKLSLAELWMEMKPGGQDACQKVVQLAEGVENDSAIHTALLLYKAKALRGLGLLEAALEILSSALGRKKDRPDDLLRALRYERALGYEGVGQAPRARPELEELYAEAREYGGVR